jgi:hypothetical protein
MALKDNIKTLRDLLHNITSDLDKAENGNKAASQRVRTGTVRLEKVAKQYRKESIKGERLTKGTGRRSAKKPAAAKKAKTHAKPAPKKPVAKAHKSSARPKAFQVRRPTAKLPFKHASK